MNMTSRISELASVISEKVSDVDKYLQENNIPSPSFAADAPIDLDIRSKDVSESRWQAIDALLELVDLLQGPVSCMLPQVNSSSLAIIYRQEIAQKVPLEGTISYEELAKKCNLEVGILRRIIRYAISFHHLFAEPEKGFVAHSNGSKLLATDDTARASVWQHAVDFYKGYARVADAVIDHSGKKPNESGYALAHDNKAIYEHLGTHPEDEQNFSKSMTFYSNRFSIFSPSHLIDNYDWHSLGTSTIVDVGGSDGSIAKALAASYPNLNFIVQDLEGVVAPHLAKDTGTSSSRVTYQAYDFFTPQTTIGDAYLFRGIFHNWPDEYVVKILRNQIPTLKPGTKLIINENLIAEPGTLPLTLTRRAQYLDMIMLTIANARLRTPDEWRSIFEKADPRFGNFRHWKPGHSIYDIMEVTWQG